MGFVAAHWRKGDLTQLHEWGLGGRRFGSVIVWFLLGGDLYTAYTFIAVPALMFGAGAVGFFAVPYTIIVYPILFVVFPRLWSVAHKHGYVTAADFVRGRFGNRDAGAGRRGHRHRRDHAVHRAAAGRHPGGAGKALGIHRRIAADHRLHRPRGLHLFQRACARRR